MQLPRRSHRRPPSSVPRRTSCASAWSTTPASTRSSAAPAARRGPATAGVANILGGGSGRSFAAGVGARGGCNPDGLAASAGGLLAKDVGLLADHVGLMSWALLDAADTALERMGVARASGE